MLNSTGEEREYYNKRQIALKWLLVVSFGYMGYKNARFGRIESHEAITAMGRELLLEAKEIAENNGFTMLHALTDAMWVTKKGAVRKDYENLKNEINLKVNKKFPKFFNESMSYEIVIEGVYKWIIFIESKKDKIGVSNRFLGLFDDYTYKIRGIELRRRDTPMFIKEFQAEILEIMKNINSKNDFRKLSKQIWQMFDDYSEKICNGKIPAEKLCVKKRMSKNPLEYKKNTDISQAAQTLIAEGIDINPGESINLIFVQGNQALPYEIFIKNPQPLNTEKYIKLLKESMIILT